MDLPRLSDVETSDLLNRADRARHESVEHPLTVQEAEALGARVYLPATIEASSNLDGEAANFWLTVASEQHVRQALAAAGAPLDMSELVTLVHATLWRGYLVGFHAREILAGDD